jgi:hypothetical protein
MVYVVEIIDKKSFSISWFLLPVALVIGPLVGQVSPLFTQSLRF